MPPSDGDRRYRGRRGPLDNDRLAARMWSGGATSAASSQEASSGWLLDIATAIVALAHQATHRHRQRSRRYRATAARTACTSGRTTLRPPSVRQIVDGGAPNLGTLEPEPIVGLSTHTENNWRRPFTLPVSYVAIGLCSAHQDDRLHGPRARSRSPRRSPHWPAGRAARGDWRRDAGDRAGGHSRRRRHGGRHQRSRRRGRSGRPRSRVSRAPHGIIPRPS